MIYTHSGIRKVVHYNEKKVLANQAECLYAGNFLKDAGEMDIHEKIRRFEHQMELNQGVKKNVVHFALGFSPGEQLDREKMTDIARSCMQRTGFGRQPYLVYSHLDAGRPHLHIVTTTIRPDGSRVSFFPVIDWVKARICHQLELDFGLSQTRDNTPSPNPSRWMHPPEKARYGARPTTDMLTDVLQYVLHAYNYRSFEQLNAILRLYNVAAIKGLPGSRLHHFHGLLYQVVDGKKKSMPVKASMFPFKPTLSWLEQKFAENARLEPATFQNTKLALDSVLREHPSGPVQFMAALRSQQVAATPIFTRGQLTGLFFIDLHNKIALSPADLGQLYHPQVLHQKLGFDPFPPPSKNRHVPNQTAETKRVQQISRGQKH